MLNTNVLYKESIKRVAEELPVNTGKILVTGASGLIGSCLVDVFQAANDFYHGSFTIYALGRNEERLKNRFEHMSAVHCIAKDVVLPIEINGVDYIINAASNADPKSYALYPVETIMTTVLGAKSVLDYCNENPSTRALLMSTFEVYGKLDKDGYAEDDFGLIDQNQLRSCYPESKRTAELMFKAYHDEYDVNGVVARLSSVYGPTMLNNDSKAHAQFLRNALNGEKIVLKSEGSQLRTYCYVMDAVSGLLAVLFNGKAGEVYNVANSKSICTIAELARVIAELSGTAVSLSLPDEIEKKGFSKPQNCVLRTEKIEALGWSGKYSLYDGIKETIEILQNEMRS